MHIPAESSLSASSGSPPALATSTIALLDEFFSAKADAEHRFREIAAEQAAARVAGLALDAAPGDVDDEKPMLTVDEYRLAFGEDWQLSQFWYTSAFATRLARCLHALCTSTTRIAFICCPTAFVAFQHVQRHKNAKLLEYDARFAILSPHEFVSYDLDEPDVVPADLRGTVDLALVDPPFLNKRTNEKIAQSLRQLLHPTRGRLLLITATSVQDVLTDVYAAPPLGPLRRTQLTVEHDQLANEFGCWGSWEGAEQVGA